MIIKHNTYNLMKKSENLSKTNSELEKSVNFDVIN